jgi:DNA invertase Pin-like site-specific DNA recombinase
MNRAGLQSLLRDARAGKFNAVLSEALDRLSRDQADIATIFKRLEFAGVEIVTLSEGRIGILDVRVRGTMNRLYSIETGNKVRRGQGNRVKEGKAAGGIPYGYDLVRRIDDRGQPHPWRTHDQPASGSDRAADFSAVRGRAFTESHSAQAK